MSAWLGVQTALLLVAWALAVRAVFRVYGQAYWGAGGLGPWWLQVKTTRGPGAAFAILDGLGDTVLGTALAESDGNAVQAEQLGLTALQELSQGEQALRGMATIATSLGLLGAIAVLRTALSAETADLHGSAARAMDCAVLGFVTGLPCWTAVALCRRRLRTAAEELRAGLRVVFRDGTVDGRPTDEVHTDDQKNHPQAASRELPAESGV